VGVFCRVTIGGPGLKGSPFRLFSELCPHLRHGAQQRLNLRLTIFILA
jgi:hypothetical protein